MQELIKREDVNEVIDALEVYTVGRTNTEKVRISVLQLHRFINTLKNIPTAYDVEKVIKLLENWTCEADIIMPFDNTVLKGRKIIASENAIGIVKEGGRE